MTLFSHNSSASGEGVRPFWSQVSPQTSNFALLRLLLAVAIIWTHCGSLLSPEYPQWIPFWASPMEQWEIVGCRVSIFFLISGFLIAHSLSNSTSIRDFFLKRVVRIYPAFATHWLLCFLVLLPLAFLAREELPHDWMHYLSFKHASPQIALLTVPVVANAFPQNPLPHLVNLSTWSLRYEFVCYVLLAVVSLVAGSRRLFYILPALFLLATAAYTLQWVGVLQFPLGLETKDTVFWVGDLHPYPRLIAFFFAGAAFYHWRERISPHRHGFLIALALLLATASLGLVGPAVVLFAPYLVFYAVFHPRFRLPWLQRGGEWGSDRSYGIYLYATPVQQLLIHFLGSTLSPVMLFVATLAPVWLLAEGNLRWIDQPVQAWLRKRGKKKTVQENKEQQIEIPAPRATRSTRTRTYSGHGKSQPGPIQP